MLDILCEDAQCIFTPRCAWKGENTNSCPWQWSAGEARTRIFVFGTQCVKRNSPAAVWFLAIQRDLLSHLGSLLLYHWWCQTQWKKYRFHMTCPSPLLWTTRTSGVWLCSTDSDGKCSHGEICFGGFKIWGDKPLKPAPFIQSFSYFQSTMSKSAAKSVWSKWMKEFPLAHCQQGFSDDCNYQVWGRMFDRNLYCLLGR